MVSEIRIDPRAPHPVAPVALPPDTLCSTDRSDTEAIGEILAGNRNAFARLVGKYQDRLFNNLTYMLQDRSEAEDVVQEALTQAYLKLSTFRYEGGFYTWLYRIAWNIACSRRRRHRRGVSLDQLCDTSGVEFAQPASVPQEDRDDSTYRVRTALAALGEQFRTVLVLRHLEGLSYETIAAMLDLPVGTVRSRIHRGRSELRRKLERGLRAVR